MGSQGLAVLTTVTAVTPATEGLRSSSPASGSPGSTPSGPMPRSPPRPLPSLPGKAPDLLPDIRKTPLGSTARQVTASRWATMECTDFPEGQRVGCRLLSILRPAWEGEGARGATSELPTWTPGVTQAGLLLPPVSTRAAGGRAVVPGRLGLTCPVVQEADASVVMGGDGEGLVWMTHHLVDLGWA